LCAGLRRRLQAGLDTRPRRRLRAKEKKRGDEKRKNKRIGCEMNLMQSIMNLMQSIMNLMQLINKLGAINNAINNEFDAINDEFDAINDEFDAINMSHEQRT
jgi:hypothetical protein